MKGANDLALLADSIAQLEDELAGATEIETLLELVCLLELAREAYTVTKARLEKRPSRRPRTKQSTLSLFAANLIHPASAANLQSASNQDPDGLKGPPSRY
jgi:hypothetical protein